METLTREHEKTRTDVLSTDLSDLLTAAPYSFSEQPLDVLSSDLSVTDLPISDESSSLSSDTRQNLRIHAAPMLSANTGEPILDEDGLPFEALDNIARDPLEFEDMAAILWDDAETLYIQAAMRNRFSPKYLTLCAHLESIIKRLGSFCVTKAVLEKQGHEFPQLKDMEVWHLYCMAAYHFQKCHEALQEVREEANSLDTTFLDWEFRWYALAERLKATADRIRKIRDGKLRIDSLVSRAEIFRGRPWPKKSSMPQKAAPAPAFRRARPFTVIKSLAAEIEHEEKERRKQRERYERAMERERSKDIFKAIPIPVQPITSKPHPEAPVSSENHHREDPEMRKRLDEITRLREEIGRDMEQIKAARSVSDPPDQPHRAGPSADFRRKQREKRKKKKK